MSSPKNLNPPVSKPEYRPLNNNRNHGKHQNNNRKKKHDRGSRKRSKSFSGYGPISNPKPVLPTKFLLGGNINDPLNLNSLQDEEINRAMNAVTPKSSPLPTPPRRKMPVEVIVSPNTVDPLHLMDCKNDEEYEECLGSPIKKARKKRLKKRRTTSASAEGCVPDNTGKPEAKTPETNSDSARVPECPDAANSSEEVKVEPSVSNVSRSLCFDFSKDKHEKHKRRSEDNTPTNLTKKFKYSMDKIVSPVVPQPGAWLKRTNSVKLPHRPRQNKVPDEKLPVFKEDNKKFQYGNYNRYYGYRNPHNETDHRLKVFSHHPYYFKNKDVLDIGCNIGHITLSVARDFGARTVTGIDIDPKLISIARKNVKHYVKTSETTPPRPHTNVHSKKVLNKCSSEFFPISMPILYGPIDVPGFHDKRQGASFPKNVTFKQCNYVLEDESLLALEQPQFDVILCLSITKWIHLNWGDTGLKLTFRRMFEQLRPGGRLILEPQHWSGYKTKKKLTETIYKNYKAIELFPDKFRDYLLSPEVGFAKSEILGFPQHKSTGFRRPILIFTKSTMLPSDRVSASTSNPPSERVIQRISTDEYEMQIGSENCGIRHLYTNITQYSRSSDDNLNINEDSAEPVNKELNSEHLVQTQLYTAAEVVDNILSDQTESKSDNHTEVSGEVETSASTIYDLKRDNT